MYCFPAPKLIVAVLCFWAGTVSRALCADILYVDTPSSSPYTQRQVKAAAQLYGLGINIITLTVSSDRAKAVAAIEGRKSVAVIISADALPALDRDQILRALRRKERSQPLMIAGVREQTNPALLRWWSAGTIEGCVKSTVRENAWYELGPSNQVTGQL